MTIQCDIEIYCTGREGCKDGELRLIGGKIEQEGFVEVCMGGAWGSLCLSSLDYKTGHVVCSRLGHKGKGEQCYNVFSVYTLYWQSHSISNEWMTLATESIDSSNHSTTALMVAAQRPERFSTTGMLSKHPRIALFFVVKARKKKSDERYCVETFGHPLVAHLC